MKVSMYCIPGQHSGPACESDTGKLAVARDWRNVRASLDKESNEWYYDPESPATIYVCPHHSVKGEPACN